MSPVRTRLTGVATVARLEFQLRIRAGRWRWLVAAWFAVLLAITALVRTAILAETLDAETARARGAVIFGVLMLIVLALALLVAPTLSAQSINGDRERGTLATLQVTRLGAAEIAIGKLLAAWGTAVVFLLVTLPLAVWCYVDGGLSVLRVGGVYLVMALLLGVVAAISLALSAMLARTTTSGVLAYLTVFALSVGTLIAFGLATLITQDHKPATTQYCDYTSRGDQQVQTCQQHAYRASITRMDRTRWLLAPNPFAVLADSAPAGPTRKVRLADGRVVKEASTVDPLGAFSRSLHRIRARPVATTDESGTTYQVPDGATGGAVWPTGLGIDLLIAAGAVVVTTRRLRTPTYRLARGQRIA